MPLDLRRCFAWCTWGRRDLPAHMASAVSAAVSRTSDDDPLPTPWPIMHQSFLAAGNDLEVGSPPEDFVCKRPFAPPPPTTSVVEQGRDPEGAL